MSSKIDRAKHGPGWVEVIFGALLAAVLGIALGAVLLALRPVEIVRELPKEADRDPKAVYFVEGMRDGSRTQVLAKRKAFLEGQSIAVTEGDLNAAASSGPGSAPSAPKAAEPGKEPVAGETVAAGTPNFRIRDGVLQMGVPLTVNTLGISRQVVVQARGGFAKEGEVFEFQPEELYIGACPLQRLPFVPGFIREKFLSSQMLPEDLKASWAKLANVTVQGNTLQLTMP